LLSPKRDWLKRPSPRIDASSDTERAALGYLHGNCGGCHNDRAALAVLGLDFWRKTSESRADALSTFVGVTSRFQVPGVPGAQRVATGSPEKSAVVFRMSSRHAYSQMPPIGTHVVDEEAVALVRRWINEVKPE
jgi:mono/diheme cytochrome c family protein